MKALVQLILISTLVVTTSVMAHGDGHGKLDKKKIIQAALTSAKMLTFKDKGMSVGKLDSSWNQVAKDQFEMVEESKDTVIVKAKNTQNSQVLYFTVSKGGKVLDVKDAKTFEHAHGHGH